MCRVSSSICWIFVIRENAMDCSAAHPSSSSGLAPRPTFTAEQRATIFRAAGQRVTEAVKHERAASTRMLLGDAAETPVYGAFVSLKRGGQLRSCCGHIELPVPLWKALDAAADRAATEDPRFPPIASTELNQLNMDVWILWGPELVEARGEDRVQAVMIGKHGVQVARGQARGLLLPGVAVEHHFDARTFLDQVCVKAGLPREAWRDDATQLRVFEGDAIHGRLPPECPESRPPVVAGRFYPGAAETIKREVEGLFAAAGPVVAETWSGAMLPHAGWSYSGRLAAAVLARMSVRSCAIMLCPKHRAQGARWAVAPQRRWLFPGGEVASDPELAARLAAAVEGLELDTAAHREEHAIEVQLPLLARWAPHVRLVGISVGDASLPELLRFGVALADALRDMAEQPVLIVSSDMNHFADDAATRRLDHLALDAITTLDPRRVDEVVRGNGISMCGLAPCVVAMETLRRLGVLKRCERVGYATSAEVSGDTNRVVGYAGLLFGSA
jgi:AmmeMemoRadiSam system protein B/AmmeMemoRadiSam system protein A